MDDKQKPDLWEEMKLLQGIIHKFDEFSFRIKNWFLTIFVAIVGYSIVQNKPSLLVLNFLVIFIFYAYELTYRTSHNDFLRRFREVQNLLNGTLQIDDGNRGPAIDKYLFDVEGINLLGPYARIMLKAGVKDERAKRNIRESRFIFHNLRLAFFQFRVSLVYVFALVANLAFIIYMLIAGHASDSGSVV